MKKELTIIFFIFILFGIILNSFVIANGNNNMGDNAAVISAGISGQVISQITEREKIREGTRIFTNAQGVEQRVFVRVEREIETKDGKTYLKIKRNFFYANGTQTKQEIKIIEWQEKGVTKRQFKLEGETDDEDIEVDVEDEIEIEDVVVGGQTKFRARLSNGNISYIEVLPDQVREMIMQKLRIRNETNMTIKLKEEVHKNIPRVVYNVQFNEHGKFLGVFKIAMRVNAEVDPSTGNVTKVRRPWWAFLVAEIIDAGEIVEECIEECGIGCPAPEFRPCASDGERYCNECVIGCYGLEVVDNSFCGAEEETNETENNETEVNETNETENNETPE